MLFIVKDSVVITDPQGVLHNPLYLVSWLAMLIALALTVISMLDYFVKAKEILGFAPSGKRAKRRAGAGEAAAADAGEDEAGGRALSAQEAASISPEALDELRAGHIIIVVDDPDRENEGDMICAAEFATQANVNLMASVAKGLICMPMSLSLIHI